MNPFRSVIIWTASLGMLLLGACQGDPRAGRIAAREAAINIGSDVRTLDPSLATDVSSARAITCFTRGLTTLDGQGRPRPELAESWTVSPDGLTYEFKLRPARWSNGRPVTAADFVHTWTRRVLNPKFGAEYAYQLFYIKGGEAYYKDPALGAGTVGARAVAPDRLRVTLAAPAPFFLSLVAHHSYYPVCAEVDKANPDWAKRAETYVGCGPFKMTNYDPGYEIGGVKSPTYWDAGRVGLEKLTLRMIEQESTERIAFESGELDGTANVPRTDLEGLRGQPELRFSPQYATYFLNINCQHKPLDDVRVRRALALAIDRRAIIKSVTLGGERPAFNLTPPELYKDPPPPAFADAQYEEARRLLAEAGFPGGKGFPKLRYIYNTLETHRQIAQVLQELWRRELGIQISIENQEFKVVIDNRRAGNFDIARAGWVADFADPINFLEIFDSKSENNDSHWADKHYDELLAACRAEGGNPPKRAGLLRQAEACLMGQMPLIPLYYQTSPYLIAPGLEGYEINPMGMFDAAALGWKTKK